MASLQSSPTPIGADAKPCVVYFDVIAVASCLQQPLFAERSIILSTLLRSVWPLLRPHYCMIPVLGFDTRGTGVKVPQV